MANPRRVPTGPVRPFAVQEERSPAALFFEEARHRATELAQAIRGVSAGGDRGSRLRVALANALPNQFGVGWGRVVSSSPKLSAVAVDDALIFDQGRNSPFFQGIGENLFPIETVLASVLRLELLDQASLPRLCDAILPLRQMAQRGKFYQSYVALKKPNGKVLANLREYRSDVPPRTYAVVDTLGWDRPEAAAKAIKEALADDEAGHLDGLLALDSDWFFHQPDNKHRIEIAPENGMIWFLQKLTVDLAMAETGALSLTRYAPG